MRIVFLVLILGMCVALTRSSSAETRSPAHPRQSPVESSLASSLPSLLHVLGIELISSARAAECTREGETCTSNEQCCPGLECSGGPPATCVDED
jgi:hypothetical protein